MSPYDPNIHHRHSIRLQGYVYGKLWQRNYYEHIIRNDQSLWEISDYIVNNPARWQTDKFFPKD